MLVLGFLIIIHPVVRDDCGDLSLRSRAITPHHGVNREGNHVVQSSVEVNHWSLVPGQCAVPKEWNPRNNPEGGELEARVGGKKVRKLVSDPSLVLLSQLKFEIKTVRKCYFGNISIK